MQLGNPIVALTDSLIDALGATIPNIEYQWQTPMDKRDGKSATTRSRRPEMPDIEIRMFSETWASTALGFGGIGGSAMTRAYTVVIFCNNEAFVYWGGHYAYRVEPTEAFMADVDNRRTEPRARAGKYLPALGKQAGTKPLAPK